MNQGFGGGTCIYARKLNDDGSYNSKGELISFYLGGCYTHIVEMKDIKVVGKLERTFVKNLQRYFTYLYSR